MTFPHEPPLTDDDTKPRPPLTVDQPNRPTIKRPPLTTVYDNMPNYGADSTRRGCASPLLVLFTVGAVLVLFIAIVGLAGLAGYRDGVRIAGTYAANTRVAVIGTQRAAIADDLELKNWTLALSRCQYVSTLTPGDALLIRCMQDATTALSATETPLPTATLPPTAPALIPATLTSAPTVAGQAPNAGSPLQALLDQSRIEINGGTTASLEKARELLEAVRNADKVFNQREVERELCKVYETLGGTYDSALRLSEMVAAINSGIKMGCSFARRDWPFTVNAAQLYLSAKGYLDAGNLAQATRVYKLMAQQGMTLYHDTKDLACQAFRQANDSGALSQYCS